MTDQETVEAVETVAEKPVKKPKAKARTKAKGDKVSRPKLAKPAATHDFDFVGKVESLLVKSGAGPQGFVFGLKGRHGKRGRFRLDPADAFAMNAMAHLVLAARASETKIGVRVGAEADGVLTVRELEIYPKIGKTG
jgi:hypothetical protein